VQGKAGVKGQSWSMDLVIAVVIFGFMAVIFYSLLLIQQKPSIEDLRLSAESINEKLEQPLGACGPIIEGQNTTLEQLKCLYGQDYETVKQQLGVGTDFCIYIQDASGRVYIIGNSSYGNKTGFGSPSLILADTPCGQAIS
jgi:hypothetical protein